MDGMIGLLDLLVDLVEYRMLKKMSHKFVYNDFNSILKLHKKLNGEMYSNGFSRKYYPKKFLKK